MRVAAQSIGQHHSAEQLQQRRQVIDFAQARKAPQRWPGTEPAGVLCKYFGRVVGRVETQREQAHTPLQLASADFGLQPGLP